MLHGPCSMRECYGNVHNLCNIRDCHKAKRLEDKRNTIPATYDYLSVLGGTFLSS